jgi:hypothetical protein
MLSVDLSLPECLYLHLTHSLIFLILGPVHLQLQLYPPLLIQHFLHLVLGFLHQLYVNAINQFMQPLIIAFVSFIVCSIP